MRLRLAVLTLAAILALSGAALAINALDEYYPYESLEEDLRALSENGCCELIETGKSRQGRSIYALRIGSGDVQALALAGVHGNEIANPPMLMQAASALSARADAELESLFDSVALVVMPCVNPDGYAASLGYYAKGKTYYKKGNADGVNLNRNFPSPKLWGLPKGSKDNAGPYPASEPETRAVMDVIASGRFGAMLDIHSSGRQVYFGKGAFSQADVRGDTSVETLDALTRTLAENIAPAKYRLRGQSGRAALGNFGSTTDYFFAMGAPAVTMETMQTGAKGVITPKRIRAEYELIDLEAVLIRLCGQALLNADNGIYTRE